MNRGTRKNLYKEMGVTAPQQETLKRHRARWLNGQKHIQLDRKEYEVKHPKKAQRSSIKL